MLTAEALEPSDRTSLHHASGDTSWHPIEHDRQHSTVPGIWWGSAPVAGASWSVPATWLLAYHPLISVVAAFVPFGSVLSLIFALKMIKRDRVALNEQGLTRVPTRWWLLLGSAFYLGSRYRKVDAAGGRGAAAPFWVSVGATVTTWAMVAVLAMVAMTLLETAAQSATAASAAAPPTSVSPTSAEISSAIQDEATTAGYQWTVTCPETIDFTAGATFSCAVADADALVSSVTIGVVEEDGGLRYQVTAAE